MKSVFIDSGFFIALEISNDQHHKDKSYSFTDCLSFLVMERLGIQQVLTFDKHFIQAGFKVLPIA